MYYYKHENGEIIKKIDYVVDSIGAFDYFDSPYVLAWWHINDETGECDKNASSYIDYILS